MIKRLFAVVLLLNSLAITLQAQLAVGEWELYPARSSAGGVIYDSGDDLVYFMSGINLFSYDKSTSEVESYNSGNYLSDMSIKNIYYNYAKDYLMVVYENSNIDLIYPDKRVVNIPDIKNTIMMSSKVINDVEFAGNRIYMATDFGLVVINDDKYEVYESYIYNQALTHVAVAGDNIFTMVGSTVYMAPIESGMYIFDDYWTALSLPATPATLKYLYAINDSHIFISYDNTNYVYDIVEDSFTEQTVASAMLYYAKCLNPTPEGFLATFDNNLRFFSSQVNDDNTLAMIEQKNISNSNIKGGYCSSYDTDRTVWCCSAAGVSHFSVAGSTLTWIMEPTFYNTLSVATPGSILVHDNVVYVKNQGADFNSFDMTTATTVSTMDCDARQWSTPSLARVTRNSNGNLTTGVLRSSYNMAFSPNEEGVFFVGSWFDGIHKFNTTSTYVGNYNWTNSPLRCPGKYEMLASYIDFDTDGNMWAVLVTNSGSNTLLGFLPREKNMLDPANVTEADWETYNTGINVSFWSDLLIARQSPFRFLLNGVLVSSTRLYVLNPQTGESRVFTTFTDQDGNSFGNGVNNFKCITEDLNGNVWIGTTSGPIVLNNVSNIMNTNYTITRVKVPRNDGTDYADYLLEDEAINEIVVDGANRKWLATTNSGVYLVSEDGTEILQNYTSSNSLLPSNNVIAMDYNDATGELFVVTDAGVASYRTDVSVAATDYSNVLAFPNPVRPDYNGWITIQGLMENSLVKITDVAGNLFFEAYANGGTVTWDGRTAAGERVKTGVYLVYASQSGGSGGVVTKIMVVN